MELVVKTKQGEVEGEALFNGLTFAAIVGRGGPVVAEDKREGDGKTPVGLWKAVRGYYRADRVARPKGVLEWQPITRAMGWCDASGDPLYNRPCPVGYAASHEELWREDEAYDYIVVLDYNMPAQEQRGSAIFLHVWREGGVETQGCVALKKEDLKHVLDSVSAVRVE